ncbi:GAF domain-containing protein [Actinacidiphila alni]|uniref:GAF domain-containing protein n=1 Tax=Actinacidiphila alni TaxID=380248 RepID=UPI0011607896|nr:GAF domain-containing protein [Actinacidiphila alni]
MDRSQAAGRVARAAAGGPHDELPLRLGAAVRDGLDVDGATLSLLTDTPARQLLAATDPAALRLEEIQFTVLEGPCISAAAAGAPVLVDDLQEALTPWPLFGASVREQLPALTSVYAFPLHVGDYVLGAMDLLGFGSDAWDDQAVEHAVAAAEAVSAALVPARELLLLDDAPPAWQPAGMIKAHWFDTHMAIGMVCEQRRVSPQNALALMRAAAFRSGRSLAQVTADILRGAPPDAP